MSFFEIAADHPRRPSRRPPNTRGCGLWGLGGYSGTIFTTMLNAQFLGATAKLTPGRQRAPTITPPPTQPHIPSLSAHRPTPPVSLGAGIFFKTLGAGIFFKSHSSNQSTEIIGSKPSNLISRLYFVREQLPQPRVCGGRLGLESAAPPPPAPEEWFITNIKNNDRSVRSLKNASLKYLSGASIRPSRRCYALFQFGNGFEIVRGFCDTFFFLYKWLQ